ALLHQGEARAALLVEGADLAVEHAVGRLDGLRDFLRNRREALRQVVALAAFEGGFSLCHAREGSKAVPLDLEQPARALRHLLLERRQHRAVLTGLFWLRAVLALL